MKRKIEEGGLYFKLGKDACLSINLKELRKYF